MVGTSSRFRMGAEKTTKMLFFTPHSELVKFMYFSIRLLWGKETFPSLKKMVFLLCAGVSILHRPSKYS